MCQSQLNQKDHTIYCIAFKYTDRDEMGSRFENIPCESRYEQLGACDVFKCHFISSVLADMKREDICLEAPTESFLGCCTCTTLTRRKTPWGGEDVSHLRSLADSKLIAIVAVQTNKHS